MSTSDINQIAKRIVDKATQVKKKQKENPCQVNKKYLPFPYEQINQSEKKIDPDDAR